MLCPDIENNLLLGMKKTNKTKQKKKTKKKTLHRDVSHDDVVTQNKQAEIIYFYFAMSGHLEIATSL